MCTIFVAGTYYARVVRKREAKPGRPSEDFIAFFRLESAGYRGGQYFPSLVALRRGEYLLANSSNVRAAFIRRSEQRREYGDECIY